MPDSGPFLKTPLSGPVRPVHPEGPARPKTGLRGGRKNPSVDSTRRKRRMPLCLRDNTRYRPPLKYWPHFEPASAQTLCVLPRRERSTKGGKRVAITHRSNIPNANLVEQAIRQFAVRNRLKVESLHGVYNVEFPDWKLLRPGDDRKSVLIRPGAYTGTVGVFITPHDADVPSNYATRGGGAIYTDIAGCIRTALELQLRSACGTLGWDARRRPLRLKAHSSSLKTGRVGRFLYERILFRIILELAWNALPHLSAHAGEGARARPLSYDVCMKVV